MALRDPRFTKFKIAWHREPVSDGTPKWWADMGGARVAEAVMTGRSGVDDYPWDWMLTDTGQGLAHHDAKTVGVTDTLRAAKQHVLSALRPN